MNFISFFISFIAKNKMLLTRLNAIIKLPAAKFKAVINSPQNFIKMVENLPLNLKQQITNEVNNIIKQFDIKDKLLKKLQTIGRKELFSFRQELAITAKSECKNLISSWIRSGCWEASDPQPDATTNGSLLLILKSNKSYVFYNVSGTTWDLMKKAKVPNGGGAGTIFWQYYWKARIGTERKGRVDKMYQQYRKRKKLGQAESDIAYFKADQAAMLKNIKKPRGFRGVK